MRYRPHSPKTGRAQYEITRTTRSGIVRSADYLKMSIDIAKYPGKHGFLEVNNQWLS
jgi:hypothetical protein